MTKVQVRQGNPFAWALPFLLLGLLLFPSTCADAAMVHSIFTDPLAMNEHAKGHHASGLSDEQIARHIALGHLRVADESPESSPAVGEGDTCSETPRVRSLPNELMISLAAAAATIDQTHGLDLSTGTDRFILDPALPGSCTASVESPPPR